MTEPINGGRGLSYVEEVTDPGTGETTRYTAASPAELEALVVADWEPDES
jgi:hypothetical protein